MRDAQAAVAADDDEGIDSRLAKSLDQLVGAIELDRIAVLIDRRPFEGIATVGGAEDGAAQMGDAANLVGTEGAAGNPRSGCSR